MGFITVQCHVGAACRFKILRGLKKRFKCPTEAKTQLEVDWPQSSFKSVEVQTDLTFPPMQSDVSLRDKEVTCAQPESEPDWNKESIVEILQQFSLESLLEVMSTFFTDYIDKKLNITIPEDFLTLSAKAMAQLKHNERSNVLYNLAKGLGTPRLDGSDSRFPAKRMPMGLVEYATNFFVADKMQQVYTAI